MSSKGNMLSQGKDSPKVLTTPKVESQNSEEKIKTLAEKRQELEEEMMAWFPVHNSYNQLAQYEYAEARPTERMTDEEEQKAIEELNKYHKSFNDISEIAAKLKGCTTLKHSLTNEKVQPLAQLAHQPAHVNSASNIIDPHINLKRRNSSNEENNMSTISPFEVEEIRDAVTEKAKSAGTISQEEMEFLSDFGKITRAGYGGIHDERSDWLKDAINKDHSDQEGEESEAKRTKATLEEKVKNHQNVRAKEVIKSMRHENAMTDITQNIARVRLASSQRNSDSSQSINTDVNNSGAISDSILNERSHLRKNQVFDLQDIKRRCMQGQDPSLLVPGYKNHYDLQDKDDLYRSTRLKKDIGDLVGLSVKTKDAIFRTTPAFISDPDNIPISSYLFDRAHKDRTRGDNCCILDQSHYIAYKRNDNQYLHKPKLDLVLAAFNGELTGKDFTVEFCETDFNLGFGGAIGIYIVEKELAKQLATPKTKATWSADHAKLIMEMCCNVKAKYGVSANIENAESGEMAELSWNMAKNTSPNNRKKLFEEVIEINPHEASFTGVANISTAFLDAEISRLTEAMYTSSTYTKCDGDDDGLYIVDDYELFSLINSPLLGKLTINPKEFVIRKATKYLNRRKYENLVNRWLQTLATKIIYNLPAIMMTKESLLGLNFKAQWKKGRKIGIHLQEEDFEFLQHHNINSQMYLTGIINCDNEQKLPFEQSDVFIQNRKEWLRQNECQNTSLFELKFNYDTKSYVADLDMVRSAGANTKEVISMINRMDLHEHLEMSHIDHRWKKRCNIKMGLMGDHISRITMCRQDRDSLSYSPSKGWKRVFPNLTLKLATEYFQVLTGQ